MNSCLGIHQQEGTLKLDLVIQGLKTMKTNLFALMLLAMFAVVGCSDAEEAGSNMADKPESAEDAGSGKTDEMAEKADMAGDMAEKGGEMAEKAMGDMAEKGGDMAEKGGEMAEKAMGGSDKK